MVPMHLPLLALILMSACVTAPPAHAGKLKVAVVQTVIEGTLDANRAKILHFIGRAEKQGCRLAIFPEGALYYSLVQ